jgi:hypothetical protein
MPFVDLQDRRTFTARWPALRVARRLCYTPILS